MSGQELVAVSQRQTSVASLDSNLKQFVTMRLDGQLFGVPVLIVQDVLRHQRITPIPLAPAHIKGAINLRGRIVTVINLRQRLGLPPLEGKTTPMQIVALHDDEPYSLMVDSVGDVMTLPLDQFESNPANLAVTWQAISLGVYRLQKELLVVLDIGSIVDVDS